MWPKCTCSETKGGERVFVGTKSLLSMFWSPLLCQKKSLKKSLKSAPKTVTKRAQKHCQWKKKKNSRPFLLCIRLHVTQQRAIGSVCHHHGNQFFKKRFCSTGDLATWRMRWRLQSRLIMEPPHSVGGKARLCYINTQAKLPQKIKRHWSRSILLLLTLLSFPKAALHQHMYHAAVNWQYPPKMDVKIILLFFVPLAGRLTFRWCGFSVDAAPSSSCERFTLCSFLALCVAAIMWCVGQTASKVQWHCIIQLHDLRLKWIRGEG